MARILSDKAREVLSMIYLEEGGVGLTGSNAQVAIALSDTKLVDLGPDEGNGSVSALITSEGRAALYREFFSGE